MFMFVFSAVLIAIAGVFLQLVSALSSMLEAQQHAIGQQMMSWHAAAYQKVCYGTDKGFCDPRTSLTKCPADSSGVNTYRVTGITADNAPANMGSAAASFVNSNVFIGTWDASAKGGGTLNNNRMLITFITKNYVTDPANNTYAGYTAAQISSQVRTAFGTDWRFGVIKNCGGARGYCIDLLMADGSAQIYKVPAAAATANTTAIITSVAGCPIP